MEKKYLRKKGECVCQNCGITFEKPLSEIKRNKKINRPNFCGRKCVGKHNIKNLGTHLGDYKKFIGYKRYGDEFTKFRYHFRNINKRNKEVNVDINDLKKQWEFQNGICEISGVKLILSSYKKTISNPIYSASLDRIDSNKGYIKGNIRWVSRAINWMKNEMDDKMLLELIDILIQNKKSSG